MPTSPFHSSPAVSLPSSSRASQKSYSARRFQAHRDKRKAEREAEVSSDSDAASNGDGRMGMLSATNKRARRSSGSPSPIKRTLRGDMPQKQTSSGPLSSARSPVDVVVEAGSASIAAETAGEQTSRAGLRRTRSTGRSRMETPEPEDRADANVMNSRTTPTAPRTPTRPATARALSAQSSPRDLSALFAVADGTGTTSPRAPASPSGKLVRPGGMRRMLTKAQSLGDALGSPTKSFTSSPFSKQPESGPSTPSRDLNRTVSMPSSPYSPTGDSPLRFDSPARPGLAVLQSDSGAGGRKAKRTYGRSRTFLEETNGAQEGLTALADHDPEERQSYAEMRRKYEVDNVDGGGSSGGLLTELQQARPPQPISDMRSKGENRRFLDEVGYLVAGLQDPLATVSLRRASSLDVLRSLQDGQWAQKVYVCGQSEALWEGLMKARADGDDVIEAIALLYLVVCASSSIGLEAILQGHSEEMLDMVQKALARDGVMQSAFALNKKLPAMAAAVPVSWDLKAPSARRHASWLLVNVLDDRYKSFVPTTSIVPLLSAAALAVAQEIRVAADRFELCQKGLPLLRDEDDFDLEHLSLCSKAISSLIRRDEGDLQMFTDQNHALASTMSDGVTILIPYVTSTSGRSRVIAADALLEMIQIQVFFAKLSVAWAARCFASVENLHAVAATMLLRDVIASALADLSPETDPSPCLDKPAQASRVTSTSEEVLCLILSLLITALTANKKKVSSWLAALEIGPDCKATARCLRQCRCSDKATFSVHLAEIYGQYRTDSTETGPVIRGYLALLLARALLSSPEGRRDRVRQTWEYSGLDEVSVELVGALESLQALHRQAGQQLEVEEGDDSERVVSDTIEELRSL